jgi:hypothetical protein
MPGTVKVASAEALTNAHVSEASIEATIIRADGRIEHLGIIAFHSRNPLKRLAWRIGRWLRGDFI